jgi:EAL domain-containing protein (putative c-di-GMP-specific phosphodiesterase class I)
MDFLRSHECDIVQGYYFSQPKPVNEVERFITGHAAAGI